MSTAQWVTTIVALVGGLAGLGTLIALPAQRRKVRADTAAVIVDSAMDLLEPLQRRAEDLKRELDHALATVRLITEELKQQQPSIPRLRAIVGIGPARTPPRRRR
jgi:hypothetical protein